MGSRRNNFRPIKAYSNINLATNNVYANYNSMQVTWARTKGRYTLSMNYAFAKAMGFVNPSYDSFNFANNYTRAGQRPDDTFSTLPTRSNWATR